MPEFRVLIKQWLDENAKSAVRRAGFTLREKAGDEENLSATAYTEIRLEAVDEQEANRVINDLIGNTQGDQVLDVEMVDHQADGRDNG